MRWCIAVLISLAVNGAAIWMWSGFGARELILPAEPLDVSLVHQSSMAVPTIQTPALKPVPEPAQSPVLKQMPKQIATHSTAKPNASTKVLANAAEHIAEPMSPSETLTQAPTATVVATAEPRQHTANTANGGGSSTGSAKNSPNRATPASAAAYLNNPQPEMPYLSIVRGESGEVKLWVKVGVRGEPLQVKVEKSSGFRRLDDAAQKKVAAEWRFDPARLDGVAVEGEVVFSIHFKLIPAP